MGYDMRWKRKPDGEEAATAAANSVFFAAVEVRDLIPREERGAHSAEEMAAIRSGRGSWDDIPANASERYRVAQEAVHEAYLAIDKAERSYFRLNIWGMRIVRDAMIQLDVAYDDYDTEAQPGYPTDVPDEYYDDSERFPEVRAQIEAHLEWSPRVDGEGGVPLHKLCSNDGWIVTPQECFVAASTIRATSRDEFGAALLAAGVKDEGMLGVFNDWVQWLADASEHGGFEVN